MRDIEYLKLLSQQYKNREEAAIEITNLSALLNLPKGTEYFFSDLHGEYESFIHLLRAASGIIRTKITTLYKNEMSDEEILKLANIIYYPEEKLADVDFNDANNFDKTEDLIRRLVEILKSFSKKHTKSRVRKVMDNKYIYILEELLYKEDSNRKEKEKYYNEIIRAIMENGITLSFIEKVCKSIRNMAVDEVHIIGDICDRGPRQDYIFDELKSLFELDIEWGNHDIAWMGAYVGNVANMLSCLRIAVRYNCFDMLEDGYGINLRGLHDFVDKYYKDDECKYFETFTLDENEYDKVDDILARRMQKALAIMQFKIEGNLIKKHPEYEMNDRILLEKINFNNMKIEIEGKWYHMRDDFLPTVDSKDPLKLNKAEEELIAQLKSSFRHSRRLGEHIKFLYDKGAVYNIINGNLLYHGIVPFDEKGELLDIDCGGEKLHGKKYFDYVDKKVRLAYKDMLDGKDDTDNIDYMMYLWCGKNSPFFGKNKMTTFENYFIEDSETHKEPTNSYYQYAYEKEGAIKILKDFGIDGKYNHIVNGHVPVKAKEGEDPIKADGKLYVIDGGLSKGYQGKTGIAGYTLVYGSQQITLASHKKFEKGKFNTPSIKVVEKTDNRIYVCDTDKGKAIAHKISVLKELEDAYKKGLIKERE